MTAVGAIKSSAAAGAMRDFLKLEVIETDASGSEHYFFIRDRSKGFFWFFNFVMKLEFNPKLAGNSESIYLLDEPGSYLHASAQTKLCNKLKHLSDANIVIYCTHSHYLLDPQTIALSSIKVADREPSGGVRLDSIFAHKGSISERRSAFQPVIDALQVKPFLLDFSHDYVVITEGIFDFYCFEMFKGGRNLSFLPSVGATSIKFYISLMIAWRINYRALWDNDAEGRKSFEDAKRIFGEEEATRRFLLLPPLASRQPKILQDLFEGEDIRMIREALSTGAPASFEKIISALYFSPTRQEVLNRISAATKRNFEAIYHVLEETL